MNYKSPQISIAILAGGKSSRMGKNKALLTYGGKTFLERLIEEFSDFDQILVSAKDENQYDLEKAGGKIRLITDEKQEKVRLKEYAARLPKVKMILSLLLPPTCLL